MVCLQAAIRKELNEFKSSEMEVHEDSRIYTRSGPPIIPIHSRFCFFPSGNKTLLLPPPGSIGLSCAADQEWDWEPQEAPPAPVPDRPDRTWNHSGRSFGILGPLPGFGLWTPGQRENPPPPQLRGGGPERSTCWGGTTAWPCSADNAVHLDSHRGATSSGAGLKSPRALQNVTGGSLFKPLDVFKPHTPSECIFTVFLTII